MMSNERWRCHYCYQLNDDANLRCLTCGAPRPDEIDAAMFAQSLAEEKLKLRDNVDAIYAEIGRALFSVLQGDADEQ